MASTNDKIHCIIRGASTAAAAAGSGLAQLPGSDNAVITPIQLAMITAIASIHGRDVSEAGALAILSSASASVVGRAVSQFLVGWIPVLGNVINAATAAAITEGIGWTADSIFGSPLS